MNELPSLLNLKSLTSRSLFANRDTHHHAILSSRRLDNPVNPWLAWTCKTRLFQVRSDTPFGPFPLIVARRNVTIIRPNLSVTYACARTILAYFVCDTVGHSAWTGVPIQLRSIGRRRDWQIFGEEDMIDDWLAGQRGEVLLCELHAFRIVIEGYDFAC